MTPEETGRLFRELGTLSGNLSVLAAELRGHATEDKLWQGQIDKRLDRLEDRAESTGRHEIEKVQAAASRLEGEKRDAQKTRLETVRSAVLLCLGALLATLVPALFGAIVRAVGWLASHP